jgi:hypothetical protein
MVACVTWRPRPSRPVRCLGKTIQFRSQTHRGATLQVQHSSADGPPSAMARQRPSVVCRGGVLPDPRKKNLLPPPEMVTNNSHPRDFRSGAAAGTAGKYSNARNCR